MSIVTSPSVLLETASPQASNPPTIGALSACWVDILSSMPEPPDPSPQADRAAAPAKEAPRAMAPRRVKVLI